MTENVVVARLFTSEEALKMCNELDSAGVEVIYEPPAFTGNYIIDWNISSPEFVIRVPENQVDQASDVLQLLEDDFDQDAAALNASDMNPEAAADLGASEGEEDGEEIPDDSKEIRMALHLSVLSWIIPPFMPLWVPILTPFAFIQVMKAEPMAETRRDHRRLGIALALTISSLIWLLAGFLAYRWGYTSYKWW
ncbi:MAG: hypothetical protein ACI97A_003940 [Planctomycetota bacterium]|jgi:hypothetical protein